MAVKALFAIESFEPAGDGSEYQCKLKIWAGTFSASGVLNDVNFGPDTVSATVNASLQGFVEAYIQSEWSIEFNQMMDSVKLVNPVSLL